MYSFGSAILFGGFIVEDEVIVWKAIHAATVGWGMSVVVGLRGMWTAEGGASVFEMNGTKYGIIGERERCSGCVGDGGKGAA